MCFLAKFFWYWSLCSAAATYKYSNEIEALWLVLHISRSCPASGARSLWEGLELLSVTWSHFTSLLSCTMAFFIKPLCFCRFLEYFQKSRHSSRCSSGFFSRILGTCMALDGNPDIMTFWMGQRRQAIKKEIPVHQSQFHHVFLFQYKRDASTIFCMTQ